MYRVRVPKMQRLLRTPLLEVVAAPEPMPRAEPLPDRFRDIEGVPTPKPCRKCGRMFATKSGMAGHLTDYHRPLGVARAA